MTGSRFASIVGVPVSAWMPRVPEFGRTEEVETDQPLAVVPLDIGPLVDPRPQGSPSLRVRRNQTKLEDTEWQAFVEALATIAEDMASAPSWSDVVQVHLDAMSALGMDWGVHHMGMGMTGEGRNFLAWHRRYLLRMEDRLREVDPSVTIPYWNWANDRTLPAALTEPALLADWGVERFPTSDHLPTPDEVRQILNSTSDFLSFQQHLEAGPHNTVHRFVGGAQGTQVGTMATSASPKDPLFWLHHAMVDYIWAVRQQSSSRADSFPTNGAEVMQPPPIITGMSPPQRISLNWVTPTREEIGSPLKAAWAR
jgi:hypothetical protein